MYACVGEPRKLPAPPMIYLGFELSSFHKRLSTWGRVRLNFRGLNFCDLYLWFNRVSSCSKSIVWTYPITQAKTDVCVCVQKQWAVFAVAVRTWAAFRNSSFAEHINAVAVVAVVITSLLTCDQFCGLLRVHGVYVCGCWRQRSKRF